MNQFDFEVPSDTKLYTNFTLPSGKVYQFRGFRQDGKPSLWAVTPRPARFRPKGDHTVRQGPKAPPIGYQAPRKALPTQGGYFEWDFCRIVSEDLVLKTVHHESYEGHRRVKDLWLELDWALEDGDCRAYATDGNLYVVALPEESKLRITYQPPW